MHLHRIVGRGPGDAGRQKLGHARLEIAAAAGILLPGGVIGELARNHDFRRHHRDLVCDARKGGNRFAELHTCKFERFLARADTALQLRVFHRRQDFAE